MSTRPRLPPQETDTTPGVISTIMAMAAVKPDHVAVDDGVERLTYDQLRTQAAVIARRLTVAGVRPGDVVGVVAPRCSATITHALGVLLSGAVYTPLVPELPAARLREMAAITGLRAAIGPAGCSAPLRELVPEVDTTDVDLEAQAMDIRPEAIGDPAPASGAYLMFTSGSTGAPKGVLVPHRALANVLRWYRSTFTPEETELVAATTSFGFDPSILGIFGPLTAGGTVRVLPSILALADLDGSVPVTLASGVPSALAELLRLGRFPASLRTLIVGGEPIPAALVRRLYASSSIRRLVSIYGPTETTVLVVTAELGPQTVDPVPLGLEIPGVEVHLTDPDGRLVPDGVVGEICISGAQVADGYVGREDLTAERFVPSPLAGEGRLYRSGDLALRRTDGLLEYKGRIDNQTKIRGHRVEPGEVQARLLQHPSVAHAYVAPRWRADERVLVAWVAPLDGPVTDLELRSHLQGLLPAYMVPSSIVVVDSLPVDSRGKVDVSRLPAPTPTLPAPTLPPPTRPGANGTATGPMSSRQLRLDLVASAMAETLGIETRPGLDDDFFLDLGGTSLLAVRLVARLEAGLGARLPVSLVLAHTTVADLAGALGQLDADDTLQLVVNGDGGDPPIVLLHAWIGGVLNYRALVPHLPVTQPLIGIAVDHDVRKLGSPSVGAMAERALVQLRTIRPSGPYLLGGHSAGGLIALEMARRLRSEGESVGAVVLIDTPARVSGWRFWRSEIRLNWDDWQARSWPQRASRIRSFLSNRRGRLGTGAAERRSVHWRLAVANRWSMQAIRTFRPVSYDGDAVVLSTVDSRNRAGGRKDLGWRPWIGGHLGAGHIDGTHDTVFDATHVATVAAHLLDAAGRLSRSRP